MKKNLALLLLAILVFPSVAFASWWNPFTWFGNWSFSKLAEPIEVNNKTEELENKVKELEEKLNKVDTDTGDITTKTVPVNEVKVINTQPIVKPQSIPEIVATDLCPNIDGVQSTIPKGLMFYKNTKSCLSEGEIDKIENVSSDSDIIKQISKKVDDLSADVKELSKSKQINNQEYSQVVEPKNIGMLAIYGSDNAFQVSFIRYTDKTATFEVISSPESLKESINENHTDCTTPNTVEVCSSYKYFIPKEVPEIRDGSYDLPDDDTIYRFKIKAFNNIYEANIKKGEDVVFFENK